MSIVISLNPELEARLREKAVQQGQDVNTLATELLARVLQWELQDTEETVVGIQQGLDDFDSGCSRLFGEFATEQCRKYDLLVDS